MGADRTISPYAYHKTFTVKFRDKCGMAEPLQTDKKGGLVWYTGPIPIKTLVLGYIDGARRGDITSTFGCTHYSSLNYTPLPQI
jgi:hypothetical protein